MLLNVTYQPRRVLRAVGRMRLFGDRVSKSGTIAATARLRFVTRTISSRKSAAGG